MKMKNEVRSMSALIETFCLAFICAAGFVSCGMLGNPDEQVEGRGELRIAFAGDVQTRSVVDIPDTSDFLLTVTGPDGDVVYDGSYGASPESIMVDAGSYTIKVRSCEFTKPAFSKPQFGDEQCVVVPPGGVADVRLTCRQLNSGVCLKVDHSFLTGCPDGSLFLKSAEGKLLYSYSEKRVAYFLPGNVSLMLSESGADKILMTRRLQPQEILTVSVSVASSPSSSAKESITVAVDTSRNWINESYVIGGGSSGKGSDSSDAFTVSQAQASVGEEDVWVCGYIVGGDLSSSSASFEAPFSSRTNIVLGPKASTVNRSSCISVQLPSGNIRDELNLVDNPSLLGRKVFLKGDVVEAYYGLVGIKNISDFELN
jgi:hypothetical protein